MSYVPPPPAPEGPVREPGSRKELWYGVAVGLFACLVLPFAGLVSPDTLGILGVGVLTPLVVLVVGVVLVIPDRTRQWGSGLLIGFCVSIIVGAGACVVLLATWNGV
jgi:hypothetical protein